MAVQSSGLRGGTTIVTQSDESEWIHMCTGRLVNGYCTLAETPESGGGAESLVL